MSKLNIFQAIPLLKWSITWNLKRMFVYLVNVLVVLKIIIEQSNYIYLRFNISIINVRKKIILTTPNFSFQNVKSSCSFEIFRALLKT